MNSPQIRTFKNITKDKAPVIIISLDEESQLDKLNEFLIDDKIDNYVLVGLYGYDWNTCLSPWKASPIFKNGEDFKGGADDYLDLIIRKIIPELDVKEEYYAIAGYSLAGLFALYAAYNCDIFSKVVSASGSLWYPGLIEYIDSHTISDKVNCLYLSLGDKGAKTKNPVMAKVEDNTHYIYELHKNKLKTVFELNEGNHFKDAEYRLYKGIKYILNN